MKKFALVLTLALVLAFAAPVFANPFSDVPADHWSYDAISKLAADGIVNGNPDGTFTGKKNITRYEMAMVVAKAVAAAEANADKIAAEDAALIQQLATEFSTELNTLGVRVDGLEKKVGNVKFTGDARGRYVFGKAADGTETSKYDGRVRLTATGTVNDQFTVVTRLTTGDYNFTTPAANPGLTADKLYVNYDGKLADLAVGRQGVTLGKATLVDDKAMNGVVVTAPVSKYQVTAMHGRLDNVGTDKVDLTAVQFDGVKLFDKLALGAGYGEIKDVTDSAKTAKVGTIYGDYALNNRIGFFGEITKSDASDNEMAYYVGTKVKNVLPKADLTVSYAQIEKNAGFVNNALTKHTLADAAADKNEVIVTHVDYAFAKDTNLYGEYTAAKAKTGSVETKVHNIEAGMEFKF